MSSYFKASNPSALAPSWAHSFQNVTFDTNQDEPYNATICSIQFEIENEIGPPVLLYYRLTNFYQNHRRYVKSEDPEQLQGTFRSNSSISGSDCDPLKLDSKGKAYYPCGLIANSVFNDTFSQLTRLNPASGQSDYYNMTTKGIAWDSDKDLFKKTAYTNDQVSPPPNWKTRYPLGYTDENPIPDISQDEGFMVWMRTAGLPTFSKLAMRNDNESMTVARYQIDIQDSKFDPRYRVMSGANVRQTSMSRHTAAPSRSLSQLAPSWVVRILSWALLMSWLVASASSLELSLRQRT